VNASGHPEGVCRNGKRGVHAAAGGEKGGIHDIKVIGVVSTVERVKDTGVRIRAEPAGSANMADIQIQPNPDVHHRELRPDSFKEQGACPQNPTL